MPGDSRELVGLGFFGGSWEKSTRSQTQVSPSHIILFKTDDLRRLFIRLKHPRGIPFFLSRSLEELRWIVTLNNTLRVVR